MGMAMVALALAAGLALAAPVLAHAAEPAAVTLSPSADAFPLIAGGKPARVEYDPTDFPGAIRAIQGLRADLAALSGATPAKDAPVVIVGTLGKSAAIDALVASGKLDVSKVKGQWEGFVQQVVENPRPGVARALVIAGADKRGTIFGAYDLSERAGVSPWTWWADVPVSKHADVFVAPGTNVQKPSVKYRGIFLNDEDPALGGWARAKFGGLNHVFYERVFELILRLKGDFLWPAMWGKSIYDDDPLSAPLADEMGVVLGTSHHEPMSRAHVEWERYGQGPWDYNKNPEKLRQFWREGVTRMGVKESLVTVGMRGDGDEPMSEGTATKLLETIVADQRKIIGEVTGKPASETPQVWALYKEVQDYYDAGMRVPDDVTLLFADDNWGDIRRLPEPGKTRPGGYGVYYHFDYVGGPRNYKWLNTNQIERTWEQMKLAAEYGADRLWIVNVGDLKPMELPIEFFLDYAWNPAAIPVEKLPAYTKGWAAQQFGPERATEIAALLDGYTKLNSRRKPELLSPETFSLTNFREAERVEAEWADLERRADAVRAAIPKDQDSAFFQLVWFPVKASANLNHLYIAAGRNKLYTRQRRLKAAYAQAERVKALFDHDAELTRQHDAIEGGKWVHMMDQTHIGYTGWQQPDRNIMPAVELPSLPRAPLPVIGVAIEGTETAVTDRAELPVIHRFGAPSRWIDVFDAGFQPTVFEVSADAPWLKIAQGQPDANGDTRLEVSVDWARAPKGLSRAPITIQGLRNAFSITAVVDNPARKPAKGAFVEAGGLAAIEAEHHAAAIGGQGVTWKTIPNLGRTLSGVTSYPSTAPSSKPGSSAPSLDYLVDFEAAGPIDLTVLVAPTLDFRGGQGLAYAVSIDDAAPVVVNSQPDRSNKAWDKAVADNVRSTTTRLSVPSAGPHRVRLWRVDPGLVFERLMLSRGPVPASYLGPPESVRAR
ncbi:MULTISPECIES: glycosyl hydrolase 115 family protein [unclassified Caulobacter]|uniref:glycosyl hydrolase 115 family protein n=1 Tax=unclassified Caulobacter TaxID=2648921 RepID=UPI0006F530AD|nr:MULTISPECIES: glycosyl hydrolase 115 family protein [unclassified Caulobacter]KQV55878.1 glycosyl hydrolase [Caulobacter sp. Root342]KQV70948.1 glycosyl hydrolase [Caulobacter sp. Root343]